MITGVLAIFVLLLTLVCCVTDVRMLRIPNKYVLAIVLLFAAAFVAAAAAFDPLWNHLAAAGIFLGVTYIMYCLSMLGAGDAKYGAALALWLGLGGLVPMLFMMALTGGVLGGIALYIKKKKPFTAPRDGGFVATVQAGENAIPYGIAITAGFWFALFHTGKIYHLLDEVFKAIH